MEFDIKPIWPDWETVELLGQGSFGSVYKAVRHEQDLVVYSAIKVISIPQHDSEVESLRSEGLDEVATTTYFQSIVSDFINEIKVMESLKGTQNIVSVEDYKVVKKEDSVGWDIYIRMELLTSFMKYSSEHKLDEPDVIKLGIDICNALEICAKRNIIHRDIKPENIFINDFGYYKLGDFGIARELEKTTGGMSQKGTYYYMAPEVVSGSNYDATVDIYSLGIVLYKLLNNNRIPFIDPHSQSITYQDRKAAVDRRLNGEQLPYPSEASEQLSKVLLKACAFSPAMRFKTANEFKKALIAAGNGKYVDTTTDDLGKTVAARPAPKSETYNKKPEEQLTARRNEDAASFDKCKKRKNGNIAFVIFVILAEAVGITAGIMYFNEFDPTLDNSCVMIIYSTLILITVCAILLFLTPEQKLLRFILSKGDLDEPVSLYAALLVYKHDYPSAIKVLQTALYENPDNVGIQTYLTEYIDKYVAMIVDEVDWFADDMHYDNAITTLQDALKILPDDETLNEKLDEVNANKPLPLSSLTALNGGWTWNEGTPQDPFGNDYTNSSNFAIFHGGYGGSFYSEYRVYKKYGTITGRIAPHSDISESGFCQVQIYADDVLVYTSKTVTRKTDAFNFSVNISNAEYIKIVVTCDWHSDMILSDVMLWAD